MKHANNSQAATSQLYIPLIGATVVDTNGTRATIQSIDQENDKTIAVLSLEDGTLFETDLAQVERHRNEFFLPALFSTNNNQLRAANVHQARENKDLRIPLQKEEIHVHKKTVDTGKGVRISKHVTEHEEIVNLPRLEEILTIEHVQKGQILAEGARPQARQEGDVYIIPVFEEVYVVEKKIRLKEEIHVIKKHKETNEQQAVQLKSEEIAIERFDETRRNR